MQSGSSFGFSRRCLSNPLDSVSVVCLSPNSYAPMSVNERQTGQGLSYPNSPRLAQTILALRQQKYLSNTSNICTSSSRLNYSEQWDIISSRFVFAISHGMETVWLRDLEKNCSIDVECILIYSRKQSMRTTYTSKWKHFSSWIYQHNPSAQETSIPHILEYVIPLKISGLLLSSLCVHLAAISAYHPPIQDYTIFFSSFS